VEAARDRVMRVVRLLDEVGDGELELVGPEPARLVRRGKAVPAAKIEEDVRGLADEEPAGLEKGWCEGRALDPAAVEEAQHRAHAAAPPRHIDIVGAGILEREANELAPPLYLRPVVKL